MKIFLTGATGFVGGAIARHLRDENDVAALARSEASAEKLRKLGLTPVLGDLLEVRPDQLRGVDVVIHCAAYVEEWGSEEDFYRTNVQGTQVLLDSARAAGVQRLIFIGTEAAFFDGRDLINIDESIQYPKSSPYLYSSTKAQAERLVLSAAGPEFVTISLRPRFVWGPGDRSVLPAILEMVESRRFAWISRGAYRISSTYIDNLVHAVEQSLHFGQAGDAFFIADEGEVELRQFLTEMLRAQGVIPPDKSIPKPLARFAARVVETAWRFLGLKAKPPLVRFSVDMLSAHCTVNTTKATKILHYVPPVSREEGLARLAKEHFPN